MISKTISTLTDALVAAMFLELPSTCGRINEPLTTLDLDVWVTPCFGRFTVSSWEHHFVTFRINSTARNPVTRWAVSYKHASTFPQHCFSFKLLGKFTRKDHKLFLCSERESLGLSRWCQSADTFPAAVRGAESTLAPTFGSCWLLLTLISLLNSNSQLTGHKPASGRSADSPELHHFAEMSLLYTQTHTQSKRCPV